MSSIIEKKKEIKRQEKEEEKSEETSKYDAITVRESREKELVSKEITCTKHPKIIEVVKIPKVEPPDVKIEFKVSPLERLLENNISTKSERSTIKIPKIGQEIKLPQSKPKRIKTEFSARAPTKGVDYFPDMESKFHYLMKKIVYHCLKRWGYKIVEVEKLQLLTDDKGRFIGYIRPDIIADGEYWEVETGYPTIDEIKQQLLKEPWDPYSRLIWKLSKYKEKPSKICVVFPSIYAHLFRDEIVKVSKYFKERDITINFYTIYLHGKGELKRFA